MVFREHLMVVCCEGAFRGIRGLEACIGFKLKYSSTSGFGGLGFRLWGLAGPKP